MTDTIEGVVRLTLSEEDFDVNRWEGRVKQARDEAGRELATLMAVSHCYERATHPLWKYNLFAMIHCQTREACREITKDMSHRLRLREYVTLFSTREFKKTRIKYLA